MLHPHRTWSQALMTALPDEPRRALATLEFLANDPVARAQVGRSPHEVIHRQGKSALRYFAPASGAEPSAPLFITMPLINTWAIFDLLPGRSVIQALNAAGVPVYLLDWGRPGPEDQALTVGYLIDTVLVRAFDRARRHARARGGEGTLDAVGYCVGGTFLTVALARHPGLARRLCLLATPIDFHLSGRLSRWADPRTFPLDDIVDGYGNFPAEMMRDSFAWLRPMGQLNKWRSLADRIDSPSFTELWAAMERWSGDNTDFAGEAYREYVRRCYFDNALVAGGWNLNGRVVDLREGLAPALVLACSDDHIVPPESAFALASLWGAPVRTETLKGGHVGVCVGAELPRRLCSWAAEAPAA